MCYYQAAFNTFVKVEHKSLISSEPIYFLNCAISSKSILSVQGSHLKWLEVLWFESSTEMTNQSVCSILCGLEPTWKSSNCNWLEPYTQKSKPSEVPYIMCHSLWDLKTIVFCKFIIAIVHLHPVILLIYLSVNKRKPLVSSFPELDFFIVNNWYVESKILSHCLFSFPAKVL